MFNLWSKKTKLPILLISCFCTIIGYLGCKTASDLTEAETEQKLFLLVNQHRTSHGLNELTWNEVIAEQCRIHSNNMATDTVKFSHDGFEERIANIQRTISISSAGENIAYCYIYSNPAEVTMNIWLDKNEHRTNIEGDFNLTGVGVIKKENDIYYFTQIYVKTR